MLYATQADVTGLLGPSQALNTVLEPKLIGCLSLTYTTTQFAAHKTTNCGCDRKYSYLTARQLSVTPSAGALDGTIEGVLQGGGRMKGFCGESMENGSTS
jgi:hypothetical protein